MRAARALAWLVAFGPLTLTACPALLSNDFRVVSDGGGSGELQGLDGGTFDGASASPDAASVSDAHSFETETGADSGSDASDASLEGSGDDAGRSDGSADTGAGLPVDGSTSGADSAAPALCCDDVPCTGTNWVGNGNVECGQLSEANVGAACYVPSLAANSDVMVCP